MGTMGGSNPPSSATFYLKNKRFMKDLWEILTTNEDGVKYTTRDYVIGLAITVTFIAILVIGSILE
jgi:hypothetical protein